MTLKVKGTTGFKHLEVLAKRQVGIPLCNQQLLRWLAHEEVLKTLARIEIIHVIIVNVSLDPSARSVVEAITDDRCP